MPHPPPHMVCRYLDHAAVYRQSGADHVDVGRRGGALPLREASARGWVRRVVAEGVSDGISVGWAVMWWDKKINK